MNTRNAKPLKAISVRQPYAWLLVAGHKDIENRKWKTRHRGRLLVHASSRPDPHIDEIRQDIYRRFGIRIPRHLPLGGVVGQVNIVDCVTSSSSRWFSGPVGFLCRRAKQLPFVRLTGRLGIFTVSLPRHDHNEIR